MEAKYIGGISEGRPTGQWRLNETNTHHLNGGLSIRSLDRIISCLQNYTGRQLAEDAVFNTCNYGNVTIGDAMAFASDNGKTMCFDGPDGDRKCPRVSDGDVKVNAGVMVVVIVSLTCFQRYQKGVHKPWTMGIGRGPPIRELIAYCPDIQVLANLLRRNENLTGKYCWGSRCV